MVGPAVADTAIIHASDSNGESAMLETAEAFAWELGYPLLPQGHLFFFTFENICRYFTGIHFAASPREYWPSGRG